MTNRIAAVPRDGAGQELPKTATSKIQCYELRESANAPVMK